jgi:ubiquinone/menaquinone biosynthesis C-methylase UbiE
LASGTQAAKTRSFIRRAVLRAWRELKPSSTAGLTWKKAGDQITFKWDGFVEAPSIPMLFGRHHYEIATIRRLLGGAVFERSLEIGCGFGRLSPTFAAQSADHTAVDINADALALAQQTYPHLGFTQVDGYHLPFPDRHFDLVVSWTVLQHVPPDQIHSMLAEVKRVLAPGGTILLCEETRNPNAPTRHSWHRTSAFYASAWPELTMKCAYFIDEINQLPGLISPGEVMLFR